MFKNVIICALAGAASAISQTYTQTDANMGETSTGVTYAVEDLDAITAEIEEFWGEKLRPFIKEHRNQVYAAAIAEAEAKHGALLETCDEGTACREKIMKELKEVIKQHWQDKIVEMKQSIKSAISQTETAVKDVWPELVDCQVEHPCCTYNEVYYRNNVIELTTTRTELKGYINKW